MKHDLAGTLLSLAALLASTGPAAAGGSVGSGAVTGTFDTPLFAGAFLEAGSRVPFACDNTGKPVGIGGDSASFTWADGGGVLAPSTVAFSGNAFTDVVPGDEFPLGILTYFNGNNSPSSLVFGLTLHLAAGDGVTAATAPIGIVSTLNANLDRSADADLLVFGSLETPSTLAAFEGGLVTAVVYGRISGDGQLTATRMELVAGDAPQGCVSEGLVANPRPCAELASSSGMSACDDRKLPAALRARIDQATNLLGGGAERTDAAGKKSVRKALKQLRRSAAIAERAAERGDVSSVCAEALRAALQTARTDAETVLRAR